MSREVTDNAVVEPGTAHHVHTIIIGSGFAGLGAAIRLIKDGHDDFLVLERGGQVGGTWRDNTYPGAACDVPSHLYSYSFALNPEWTRSFSRQPEIQAYIVKVAEQHKVLDKHRFGCDVVSARWNNDDAVWELDTTHGQFTANIVISAVGALCEPALPDIEGIDKFKGEVFHSARWNHEADLRGKRIAVIGTGASAIQIVPELAKQAAQLDVYQRTAPWVLPRMDRPYTPPEKFAFKKVPGYQRLVRTGIYLTRELEAIGLTKQPKLNRPLEWLARGNILAGIRNPELRHKVTPNFEIGCKRMLISNEYYPALDRDNVELVTDGIAEVGPDSVTAKDGTIREVDAIVVATGFHVTDSPTYAGIFGRDGRSLAEVFDDEGQKGYKGSAIANFPNMFFLVGPNTGLGHTSMIFMIESQIAYVADALGEFRKRGLRTLEVRKDAQDSYNRKIQDDLASSVWNTGGCSSWYLDKHGNNTTLWPGFTFVFRWMLRKFDIGSYQTSSGGAGTPRPPANSPKKKDKVAAK